MKFKMRALYFSPAGNTEKMARAIAKAQESICDQIPPAYPSENEKLLFIGVEMKGSSANKVVLDLCRDLTPSRAKNVAFFAVGSGNFSAIEELKTIVKGKGLEVVGSTYECTVKGGLFKQGKVTDADVDGVVAWAANIVDSLAV
ncbi:flavodoxin family protein [Massiliimalia massiliensis]|uniref:flavodoxin family protein n=1 Tax=Massiliimalia massiliensis TaxID=1852384 RepID=UPI0009843759|nr:hypothetical protein [Massiliimalia massiliensis]